MCYKEISKLLGWRVAATFLETLGWRWREFCSRMTEHGSQTNRNVVSRYRRKLPSALQAFLVLRWLLAAGDLSSVMDERTQTLPTAQYRTRVREDLDATRAIRIIYTFPPCDIAAPKEKNEIAAGNTYSWKENNSL